MKAKTAKVNMKSPVTRRLLANQIEQFSACEILRWMGRKGFTVAQATAGMKLIGKGDLSHNTVRSQVQQWTLRGEAPAMPELLAARLNSVRG